MISITEPKRWLNTFQVLKVNVIHMRQFRGELLYPRQDVVMIEGWGQNVFHFTPLYNQLYNRYGRGGDVKGPSTTRRWTSWREGIRKFPVVVTASFTKSRGRRHLQSKSIRKTVTVERKLLIRQRCRRCTWDQHNWNSNLIITRFFLAFWCLLFFLCFLNKRAEM